jgi:hypothetical protein
VSDANGISINHSFGDAINDSLLFKIGLGDITDGIKARKEHVGAISGRENRCGKNKSKGKLFGNGGDHSTFDRRNGVMIVVVSSGCCLSYRKRFFLIVSESNQGMEMK